VNTRHFRCRKQVAEISTPEQSSISRSIESAIPYAVVSFGLRGMSVQTLTIGLGKGQAGRMRRSPHEPFMRWSDQRMTAERAIVCRGIRGATTASANTAEEILESTHELLQVVIRLNDLDPADVASVI